MRGCLSNFVKSTCNIIIWSSVNVPVVAVYTVIYHFKEMYMYTPCVVCAVFFDISILTLLEVCFAGTDLGG